MVGTYTNLLYHLIFSTKHREQTITTSLEEELYRYIAGIIRNLEDVCLEINGRPDHVHILAKLRPKIAISEVLQRIKGSSSKWANEQAKINRRFSWQDGYSAFSVSESQVDQVRQYLRNQKIHHTKWDFKSETLSLLKKHEIEYDERYLWD